jgi:DNA-binding transcriptional regulator YdaS (Cro superfamily)
MAVAALVLSIVAVVVAGLSAWYTRSQAVSAEGVRRIEAARRQDELRPSLDAEYVDASDTREGQRPGVKLTNRGPLDLDHVDVSAVPAHRAYEAVIEGLYDYRTDGTAPVHETGILRRGESWTFEVIPTMYVVEGSHELERGGTVAFRCTSYVAGHAEPVKINETRSSLVVLLVGWRQCGPVDPGCGRQPGRLRRSPEPVGMAGLGGGQDLAAHGLDFGGGAVVD